MRVLIVEDEALVAMEIEAMLAIAGHDAIGPADDLETALAILETEVPDLALVDIKLARGCSGLDVATVLQARGVPVIFASGNCDIARGRGLGLGCLHKPINDHTLAAAVSFAGALMKGQPLPAKPVSLHLFAEVKSTVKCTNDEAG